MAGACECAFPGEGIRLQFRYVKPVRSNAAEQTTVSPNAHRLGPVEAAAGPPAGNRFPRRGCLARIAAADSCGGRFRRAAWWLAVALGAAAAGAAEVQAPLVVRIFDDFRTAADLGFPPGATDCQSLTPFVMAVVEPLLVNFSRSEQIDVTEEDLKDCCRRQLPEGASFREAWAEWEPGGSRWGARQRLAVDLKAWKLQQALFARYGGQVLPRPGGQPLALDAIVALVAEREQAGDLTFYDERLKIRFWECLRFGWGRPVAAEEGRPLIEQHPLDRGSPAP